MHRSDPNSDSALIAVLVEWAAAVAAVIAVAALNSIGGAIAAGALFAAMHFGASSMEQRVGLWAHAGSAATVAASLIFVAIWAGFGLTAGLWLLAALAGLLVIAGTGALLQRRPDDDEAQQRNISTASATGVPHTRERDAPAEPMQRSGPPAQPHFKDASPAPARPTGTSPLVRPPPSTPARRRRPESSTTPIAPDAPAPREESPTPNLRSKPSGAPSRAASHTATPQAAGIRTGTNTVDMAWVANLTWVTLRTMRDLPQPAHNNEIDDAVAVAMNVSVAVRLHMRDRREGHSEWGYRVGWARSALHNHKWIERPADGWWRVTPRGATASEEDVATHARQYFTTKRGLQDYSPASLPGLEGGDARLQSEPSASPTTEQQLTAQLWSLAPVCFEELCAELLRAEGYHDVKVIGGRGDDGIDVLAKLRESADPATVYVQCKAWRGEVGVDVVLDFRQALNRRAQRGRPGQGRLMTTGHFSRKAIEEARRNETPLDLIDGNGICALLAKQDGVVVEWTDELEVNRRWFEEFAENCRAGDRYRNQAGRPGQPLPPDLQ